MLFHLKEPNYQTEAPNDIVTRFYGRNPQQILTCLDYYTKRMVKDGLDVNTPNLVWWLKRRFSAEDIDQVQKGKFQFFTGMISLADGEKRLFEEIKVADDFSVYVPEENIGDFAFWRMQMTERERGGLYKLQNPIEMFMNLSFVPEDIARAITNSDLTQYKNIVEEDMKRRRELSSHPNIEVDGLERTLKARKANKARNN